MGDNIPCSQLDERPSVENEDSEQVDEKISQIVEDTPSEEEDEEALPHSEILDIFEEGLARLVQDPLLCDLPIQVDCANYWAKIIFIFLI